MANIFQGGSKSVFQLNKNILSIIGVVFLCIMAGMVYWIFQEFVTNYYNLEISNNVLNIVLDQQTVQLQDFKNRTKVLEQNLNQTLALVEDYEIENGKLREQVKLLDDMDVLQQTIAKLQGENALVVKELEELKKKQDPALQIVKISSLKEGRELIGQHRKNLKDIRKQIYELERQMYHLKVAKQKELDLIESQSGNKGYLIQDGVIYSPIMISPNQLNNINIDVKFVK